MAPQKEREARRKSSDPVRQQFRGGKKGLDRDRLQEGLNVAIGGEKNQRKRKK